MLDLISIGPYRRDFSRRALRALLRLNFTLDKTFRQMVKSFMNLAYQPACSLDGLSRPLLGCSSRKSFLPRSNPAYLQSFHEFLNILTVNGMVVSPLSSVTEGLPLTLLFSCGSALFPSQQGGRGVPPSIPNSGTAPSFPAGPPRVTSSQSLPTAAAEAGVAP